MASSKQQRKLIAYGRRAVESFTYFIKAKGRQKLNTTKVVIKFLVAMWDETMKTDERTNERDKWTNKTKRNDLEYVYV